MTFVTRPPRSTRRPFDYAALRRSLAAVEREYAFSKAETTVRPFANDDWWRVLHKVADDAVPGLQRKFIEAIDEAVSKTTIRDITRALANRNIQAVEDAIPYDVLANALRKLEGDFAGVLTESGRATAAATADLVGVTVRFDLVNLRAAEYAASQTADLIVGVTDDLRSTVRYLTSRAILRGGHPRIVARQLVREGLGLTTRQAAAVQNYRAGLQHAIETGLSPESLSGRWSLNPVRFPGQMKPERVDEFVQKYRDRMLRHRSENIMRTETINSANEGQIRTWEEGVRNGDLEAGAYEREWIAVKPSDGRTCRICLRLDGNRAGLTGVFVDEQTGRSYRRPTAHPSCRCTNRLRRIRRRAA